MDTQALKMEMPQENGNELGWVCNRPVLFQHFYVI